MRTIWKFPLKAQTHQTVLMPKGAEPLCAQVQGGKVCLWCSVDSEREQEPRTFAVYGMGHEIPQSDWENQSYIGTVQLYGGELIFHVFEIHKETT